MKLRLSLLALTVVGISYVVFHPLLGSISAQTTKQRVPSCCGSHPAIGPREVDFPYYNLTNGWSSTLNLVSAISKSMDFTVVIKGKLGETLISPETIGARSKLAIDLGSLITQLGGDASGAFAEGSVALQFTGSTMPLVGQITMTNPALSLVSESVMVERDAGRTDVPAVLNGVWWGLAGREGRVMVSNVSSKSQSAQVYLDFQGERHAIQTPLTFLPYETKVLSLADLLGTLGVSPAQAPEGGITIIQTGPLPSLIAAGRITDAVTGFSTTMDFPSSANEYASALHATGLPVGTPPPGSPFAGGGAFVPHVIVRNLTDSPQAVNVTVEYPQPATTSGTGQSASPEAQSAGVAGAQTPKHINPAPPVPGDTNHHPEWGKGTGGTAGMAVVASLPVAPYSAVDYSLAGAISQLPLPLPFCSVRIQYSGAPGSVQAQVTSVEARGNLVVDSHVQNEGNGWTGSGANPWHLDANTESILFLTNESDKAAAVGFAISANSVPGAEGVHYYLTKLRLNPHETRVIDLRQLRDAQVPDFRNSLIPANATDGTITWNRNDNVAIMGRVMVINRQAGLASNYDCCTNYCPNIMIPNSTEVSPANAAIAVNNGQQYDAVVEYSAWSYWQPFWIDITDFSSWSSQYTSVATINGAALATGVGGGTTSIGADDGTGCAAYTAYYYQSSCVCTLLAAAAAAAALNVGPHITSISPNMDPVGPASYTVTINGSGFGPDPISSDTVNAGNNIGVNLDANSSDTTIVAEFLIQTSDPGGNHSVTVTTPAGTSNSVNFFVQIPTSVSVYSDTGTSENVCSLSGGGSGCGSGRLIKWQVLDQEPPTGKPIQAVMSIYDTIQFTPQNDFGITKTNTTCSPFNSGPCGVYTNANGITPTDTNQLCTAACISGSTCIEPGKLSDLIQTWIVNGIPVAPNTLNVKCGSILINGQP